MGQVATAGAARITLVQYPGLTRSTTLSPPCGKVHMALRFKGLPYQIRNLSSPMQVRRHNPRGRVPVLRIDGESIVDSTDILTALERRFPQSPLEPAAEPERSRVKLLEDWADEVLYFYGVYLRWCVPQNLARMRSEVLGRLPAPARWIAPLVAVREVQRRVRGQGVGLKPLEIVEREFDECLDAVVALLEGAPYLVGQQPTRADLAVCAVLDQLALESLTPDPARRIGSRGELVAWRERVHRSAPDAARPASAG